MGAKDWIVMYAETEVAGVLRSRPQLDRELTRALVERLHPGAHLTPIEDGSLDATPNPPDGEIYAGVFPGVTAIASGELALDHPSTLPQRFVEEGRGRTLYLHAMHSVVDWFAYAIWENGSLRRALSLSPDDGILENLGEPLAFEKPYWAGEHSVDEADDDVDFAEFSRFVVVDGPITVQQYPLAFHPLELAEEALRSLFGFTYEGVVQDDDPELDEIVLAGYRLS
jgi:hypothetical protein